MVDLLKSKPFTMKKMLLLVLPFLLMVASCDPSHKIIGGDENAKPKNITHKDGTGYLPAQVWEEITDKPLGGVTVEAQMDGKSIETATTDDKGNFAYEKLTNGKVYTLIATKKGYVTAKGDVKYDGTNSLPTFILKPLK